MGASVNAIKEDNKPEGNGRSDQKSVKCYRCGQSVHFACDKHCPARSKTCTKCHMTGHFASVCRTKSKQEPTKKNTRKQGGQGKVNCVGMMNMLLLWDSVNHGTGVDQCHS